MRICLLGCGGFVGSHLVEWLLEHTDATVVGTDIDHERVSHLLTETRFTYYDSDLRFDRDLTHRLIDASDVLVDLVSVVPSPTVDDAAAIFEIDFLENLWVAQQCAETGTRLVQFSSSDVYGKSWPSVVPEGLIDPERVSARDVMLHEDSSYLVSGPVHKTRWIYGASKHLLERAIHAYGVSRDLDYTVIRPFNILGPRFMPRSGAGLDDSPRVFATFMDALIDGTRMRLADGGSARRTFIHIEDAISCIGRIVLDEQGVCSRETFNIGNPDNETTIEALARLMYDLYAAHHWDGNAPLPEIVSVPAEELFGAGYDQADRLVPSIDKARRAFGWEPRWALSELLAASMAAYIAERRT